MTMSTVAIHDEGGVRTLLLNRPDELNALSQALMDDLCDGFLDARDDDTVKVVLVTGAGRAFCAGADLAEMGRKLAPPRHGWATLVATLIDFPKPVLFAVNGVAVGGGATLCGLADCVWISETARLRCPFSALGLTAEAASTVTFPALMGRQRANWFLLSSEWLDAHACVEAGLALEVLPPDMLVPHAQARARTLAALPLASLQQTKQLLMDPIREQLRESARNEDRGLAELVGGPANREALAAFMEKREPDFSGL